MCIPQRATSTATPIGFSTVVLTTLLLFCCNNLQADIVQYTFTGQITEFAFNTHSEIENGEFWEANFFVDTSIPDDDPTNSEVGFYLGAVINGSLSFSGGYTSPIDFTSFDVNVFNDANFGILIDAVSVLDESLGIDLSAATIDTTTLTSISLPEPGTSLTNTVTNVFQLIYEDVNGEVSYTPSGGDPATNNTFSASAIPEPSSFLAVLLMTMSATIRRRK